MNTSVNAGCMCRCIRLLPIFYASISVYSSRAPCDAKAGRVIGQSEGAWQRRPHAEREGDGWMDGWTDGWMTIPNTCLQPRLSSPRQDEGASALVGGRWMTSPLRVSRRLALDTWKRRSRVHHCFTTSDNENADINIIYDTRAGSIVQDSTHLGGILVSFGAVACSLCDNETGRLGSAQQNNKSLEFCNSKSSSDRSPPPPPQQ